MQQQLFYKFIERRFIMNQSSLSRWLKAILIVVGLCGLFIIIKIVPDFGHSIVADNPEFNYCYLPWLILICITAVPCYVALVFTWKIADNIGASRSFSMQNSKLLKLISILAIADALFFFITNIVYLFLNMNHPGIILISLIVSIIGVAISVVTASLSHLVMKSFNLQRQSDLTI